MILTCPECAARYDIKDEAFLPSGRRVRCAKCGHSWYQDPPEGMAGVAEEPEAPPEPEAPSEPEPTPAAEPAPEAIAEWAPAAFAEPGAFLREESAAKRVRTAVIVGWVLLALAVLGLLGAGVGLRQSIVALWPRTASLYAALGMPVNASGVTFADVRYTRQTQDNQSVLAISGTLVNITRHSATVPPIRVILRRADGRELYRWQFRSAAHVLAPGQNAPFSTRLSNPPDAARHLTLEFAANGGNGE